MTKEDRLLWKVLAITGLNFVNHRIRKFEKYFKILFLVFFSLSFIYVAIANLRQIFKKKRYKIGVCYSLFAIYSALLWYCAYSRKKYISNVVYQTYYYRKRYHDLKKRSSSIISLMVVIIVSSPFLASIFAQLLVNFETESVTFWNLDYEMHSIFWKRILLLNANIAYYLCCVCFPSYLAFSFSVLFYRCPEILSNYNKALQF